MRTIITIIVLTIIIFNMTANAIILEAIPPTTYIDGTEIPYEVRFSVWGQLWASQSLIQTNWILMQEVPFIDGQPYRWTLANPIPNNKGRIIMYFKATSIIK